MFSHHQRAKIIYDYFQEKYKLGVVGLWHLYGINSTCLKGEKEFLSSIIVAPAGAYKSSIMSDVQKMASNRVYELPDQLTDRGLVTEMKANRERMDKRMWHIQDATTSFPTLEDSRQKRLLGAFVKILTDGKYSYSDFSGRQDMFAKTCLYVNIADNTFKEIYSILKRTTIHDRLQPFRYTPDPVENRGVRRVFRNESSRTKVPKAKFIKDYVEWDSNLDTEFEKVNDVVAVRSGISEQRSDTHLSLLLKSIAIFEGRNKVTIHDITFTKKMFMRHLTLGEVEPIIVMAFLTMLRHTRHAELTEAFSFFESDLFKTEFPEHYKIDIKDMKIDDLRLYFNRALTLISQEEEVLERISKFTKDLPEGVTNVI